MASPGPDELLEEHNHSLESPTTSSDVKTHRKRRILFTREQTYELQKVFQYQQYLTVPQRDFLSRKINLTPTQVKIWFQNHRYKLKKYVKECHSKPKPKPKTTSSHQESKNSTILSGYDRPPFLMERLSPLSRSELRTYRSQSPPERPTMYPFRKPYTRVCSSPDRFPSYRRSPPYTASSSSLGCCECEKYAPPPTLTKWKRCESESGTSVSEEKD
uniref:Homeobox domain-containing protein n=1 Tax=Clytia hemisphaerica TaxID=252671 RepID=A0A7M5X515_9CNID